MSIWSKLKSRPSLLITVVTFSFATLGLAACSGGDSASPTQVPAGTPSPAPQATTTTASDPLTIAVTEKDGLGNFLTGPGGGTLYVFTRDVPNASNCVGDCISTWPPLLQEEDQSVSAGGEVSGAFSYIDTPAGEQVTFNGAPLYYFSGDSQPGDTNGNLIGGVWFVARPDTASTAVVGVNGSGNSAFLVGPTGETLYLFANDASAVSNCSGQCISNWPALTVPEGMDPTAVDAATGALDVITRTDNSSHQVTYDGRPLYYFAGDSVPGDTKGDGVGGVWSIARP
jgi:predicted lipoprotein with Yx(FWY)xxD motif